MKEVRKPRDFELQYENLLFYGKTEKPNTMKTEIKLMKIETADDGSVKYTPVNEPSPSLPPPDNDLTWENSFKGSGYYIDNESEIYLIEDGTIRDSGKNLALTKAHCKSMLAFAQLSHIIAKANGDWVADWKDGDQAKYCIDIGFTIILLLTTYHYLAFRDLDTALRVREQNAQLIKDYYMI